MSPLSVKQQPIKINKLIFKMAFTYSRALLSDLFDFGAVEH